MIFLIRFLLLTPIDQSESINIFLRKHRRHSRWFALGDNPEENDSTKITQNEYNFYLSLLIWFSAWILIPFSLVNLVSTNSEDVREFSSGGNFIRLPEATRVGSRSANSSKSSATSPTNSRGGSKTTASPPNAKKKRAINVRTIEEMNANPNWSPPASGLLENQAFLASFGLGIPSFRSLQSMPKKKLFCFVYFFFQAIFILSLEFYSGIVYTEVGEYGHQIWPCSAALAWGGREVLNLNQQNFASDHPEGSSTDVQKSNYISEATGRPIHDEFLKLKNVKTARSLRGVENLAHHSTHSSSSSDYLVCVFTCFFYVVIVLVAICDLEPKFERNILVIIGGISFAYTFWSLGASLEACSVWCWSTGAFGIYFLLRPSVNRKFGVGE